MLITPVAPRAIIDGALEHLPKTFDESWLRDTWSGTYGRKNLTVSLDDVASRVQIGEDTITGTARASGRIKGRFKQNVGQVTRKVELHTNGRLGVYHAYLKLDDSMHRTGFARAFNDRAFQRYADAGVDDVTVSASLTAGGYVWARTGFEMNATPSARASSLALKLVDATLEGRITRAEYDAIEPRLLLPGRRFDPDVHMSSIIELAQMDIGERVLKGTSFSGIRPMHPTSNWWAPSSTADASLGAAHLRPKDAVPAGVTAARQAVVDMLPEAFDPAGMAQRLEDATAALDRRLVRVIGASTELDVVKGTITGSLPMAITNDAGRYVGAFDLRSELGKSGLITTQVWSRRREMVSELTPSIEDALRGAGVARINTKSGIW